MIRNFAIQPANPLAYTTVAGTAVQPVTTGGVNLVLNATGADMSGKPFRVVLEGSVKAAGASQTVNMALYAGVYSSAGVLGSLASVFAIGASGTLTAATIYPFIIVADLFADNASAQMSGIAYGLFNDASGGGNGKLTTWAAASAITSGVAFGSQLVSAANQSLPAGSQIGPAIGFVPQLTNSVTSVTEVVTINNFYMVSDM